jgi:hypothetical protein
MEINFLDTLRAGDPCGRLHYGGRRPSTLRPAANVLVDVDERPSGLGCRTCDLQRAGEHSTAGRAERVDASLGTGERRAAKGGVVVVCEEPRTVAAAVGALAEARDCWDRAYRAWRQAVERRDRVISESDRRVRRATGGLGLRAWEAACRRRRVNTRAEANIVARAVRSRRPVEMAVEEAERRRAAEDRTVLAARLTLAEATKQVLAYGTVGRQLTGVTSSDFDALARRAPTSSSFRDRMSRLLARDGGAGDASSGQPGDCIASDVHVVNGTARGGRTMAARDSVRNVKRRLADLDAQHARAVAKLNRASARRAELVADQDRLVAVPQKDVDRAVGAMADALGVQLTAKVLGLDPADVRRVVKSVNRDLAAGMPRDSIVSMWAVGECAG